MNENSNYHILIVDDEKLNIELAAAYLKDEGYKLSFALNAKSALASISAKDIDLILLDINMPETDGFKVCELLKAEKKTKDIPIVFLTAQTDIKYISRAFEVGGVDYINKPFNGIELKARVKTHLQSVSYIKEIKEKQSKLAQLSITDPLTKLHNSLFFDAQLKSHITQDQNFWVIYIKINNFNKINSFYGFEKANTVLKLFSKLVQEAVFPNAIVARLYGASFGILMKNYDKKTIKEFSNSLSTAKIKHKDLSKSVNFSIVALNVKGDTTISTIHKKLETGMQTSLDDMSSKILFTN